MARAGLQDTILAVQRGGRTVTGKTSRTVRFRFDECVVLKRSKNI